MAGSEPVRPMGAWPDFSQPTHAHPGLGTWAQMAETELIIIVITTATTTTTSMIITIISGSRGHNSSVGSVLGLLFSVMQHREFDPPQSLPTEVVFLWS